MKDGREMGVLILGGGVMQLPAIRIAKRKGWRTVVADASPDAPGAQLADRFENVDLKDRNGIANIACQLKRRRMINGVFTTGTDFSTTVAWAAEKAELPGIPFEAAVRASDKCLMRRAFQRADVPSPPFVCLTGKGDINEGLKRIPFPAVVKPADSMGARGVKRVESVSEAELALMEALARSVSRKAIMESYMEGPELSLDAIVHDGKITICGVADRIIRFPPFFVEMGHTMPSALDGEIIREAEAVFRKGIRALGITYGAAKGDLKVTEKGIMVGEIAARLSGGYMSGWTYPYSSGVEATEAALNLAVGLPPGDLNPKYCNFSAERALLSIPGAVHSISGGPEARNSEYVEDVFFRISPGDSVTFPKNNIEKCGNVITRSIDRGKAVISAEYAVRRIIIRLAPNNSATEAFIAAEGGVSAFELTRSGNIAALQRMPALRKRTGKLAIIPLPEIDRESSCDWHGMSLSDAFQRVITATGIREAAPADKDAFLLGKSFWKALLRGGVQGGTYHVDSVISDLKQSRSRAVA